MISSDISVDEVAGRIKAWHYFFLLTSLLVERTSSWHYEM